MLVGLNGQLRNLAGAGQLRAAAPVTVTPEGIHVGQNPGSDDEIGLLAGLAKHIEPDSNAIDLETHEEFLGCRNLTGVGGRIPMSGDSLNK